MSKEIAVRQTERLTRKDVETIKNTDLVPKHYRGDVAAIFACVLTGRALGLDDMESLRSIYVVDGKATLSAELMVKLARRAGHSITGKVGPDAATVTGKRGDTGDEMTCTWTLAMAKRAGLAGKQNWTRYPESMLWARAASQLCRMLFPDVLGGVSHTADEVELTDEDRVAEKVSDLPLPEDEDVRTREEPTAGPSDAQLNRIAALEAEVGDGAGTLLYGAFGVDSAQELNEARAAQYEASLQRLADVKPDEGEIVSENGDPGPEDGSDASLFPVPESVHKRHETGVA